MREKLVERFLRYVKRDTQSDDSNPNCPSTETQRAFANALVEELHSLGIDNAEVDKHGYVYAYLPANLPADKAFSPNGQHEPTAIGFIAHLDTSPDYTAVNVNPQIVENYDGTDIILDSKEGITLPPSAFPELLQHKGEDIITTDGHTLLGADDKAGIAEIMTAVEYLVQHPDVKHGKVCIAFTPDEEIGRGATLFDVARFGAEYAYTVDGGEVGELEYENFNAAIAAITFEGNAIHPGYAYGKMRNAQEMAVHFINSIPNETPSTTKDYEGYYHLYRMAGNVDKAVVTYLLRDFTDEGISARKQLLSRLADAADGKIEITDQYRNMSTVLADKMYIIERADKAMRDCGITPIRKPIRGGTDGATLSFMGLPCPNIFAGGINFHGRYEFVPIQSMERATRVILQLITTASRSAQLPPARSTDTQPA